MPSANRSSSNPPAPSPPPQQPPPQAAGQQFVQMLPNAGQQADLQLINSLVEQLCEIQADNRRKWDIMLKDVEQMRQDYEKRLESNDQKAHFEKMQVVPKADYARLQADYEALYAKYNKSQEHIADLADMNADYQDVLASVMVKVRDFSYSHNQALIGWHEFYNRQVQKQKDENLQLRLEHSRWQEGLGRANYYARMALRCESERDQHFIRKIAGQRRQIIEMRRALNWVGEQWDFLDDDDEEPVRWKNPEDEEDASKMRLAMGRLEIGAEDPHPEIVEQFVAAEKAADAAKAKE